MRPNRIIVGEVRGPEALDMLQAMNTGHEGSLTTIHANDTHDAISRLQMMVAMARLDLPSEIVQSYICSGISLLIHLARLSDGTRKVVRVSELEKSKSGYKTNDIFVFKRDGVTDSGEAKGTFAHTGYRAKCLERLEAAGVDVKAGLQGTLPVSVTTIEDFLNTTGGVR